MALPANAFAELDPAELPVGSVFKFRDSWALLVSTEDERTRDFLMLGGERSGQIFSMRSGMPRCLAVVAPFSWFAAIDEGCMPTHIEHRTATLTLSTSGPVIIGAKEGEFDDEYLAFDLGGVADREYQSYGAGLRFSQWTVELQHCDRPYKSIGRLFSVSVAQA